ncbi:MAG: NAD-dependent epimerase/dehydratase family protein [Clostridiales bacterium]|nr:NAD-dependent epimerase/dehydratase family protein [Clostridiales bacterium]
MNVLLLGAAGFIGTNLAIELAEKTEDRITLVDKCMDYFLPIKQLGFHNIQYVESKLLVNTDFDELLAGQDVVYHLVSTTAPATSNQQISKELEANVVFSSNLFEACAKNNVKQIVFISSGGTVYGQADCPLKETTATNPISSYGIQKITIEKLLYLYSYMYGMDYRIIRLSNPYGPYQRPNGVLGAVTTFTYKALRGEEISVYGDGSVVRDFIYIDDAVKGIMKIVNGKSRHHIFNLGCGYGTSIKQLLDIIEDTLNIELKITYKGSRQVDVPVNYLDISRYEQEFGKLNPISLEEGIKRTAEFMRKNYGADFIGSANVERIG